MSSHPRRGRHAHPGPATDDGPDPAADPTPAPGGPADTGPAPGVPADAGAGRPQEVPRQRPGAQHRVAAEVRGTGVTSSGRRPSGASRLARPATGPWAAAAERPWTSIVGGGGPLAAAVLSAVAGHWPGAVVCLSVAVGVVAWDRWATRAELRVVESLARATAPRARVGGRVRPATEVEPGTAVDLSVGDVVPAAGRVVTADGLLVDDVALVGEAPAPRRCSVGDAVREGAVVLRGHGSVEVSGQVSGDHSSRRDPRRRSGPGATAPRRRSEQRRLVAVAAATAAAAMVTGTAVALVRGDPGTAVLSASAVLAVLAAPALAVRVSTGRRAALAASLLTEEDIAVGSPAVLDRLSAVDLLAVATPAAVWEDRETVRHVWTAEGPVAGLARAVCVGTTGLDPAAERGLVEWAVAMGVDVDGVRAAAPQVAEVPYDAARRRVTTAHDDPAGVLVVCKGAPEAVWPLLVTSTDGKSSGAAAGRPVADRWTAEGLRVVAVATTRRTVVGNTAGRLEAGLRLVGLVALDGRVRDGSAEAVAAAGAAGIDVVLVTPDHESTALARARRVGITTARRGVGMVTGDALRTGRWADDLRVLARMAPDQHRDAVARWRSAGHVVALTGAGTAEIPAVRLADVGIALGPGDEALAAAADIRTDRPDLAAVNAAVVAGRRARAVTRLLLGLAAAALLAVGAAVLVGAAVGTPWLWPEQAALAAVVVTMVPAALLARENSLSGLPPGGQHPASRLVDTWWSLWTLGWGVGTGLFALLVGGAVLLAGASPGLVAGPIVAGALAGAAVTGARAVRGPHPARAAGWILVAAVVVLAAAVAGVAWARDGGATGTGVLVAPAVLLGSAVAGAIAARGRPHA